MYQYCDAVTVAQRNCTTYYSGTGCTVLSRINSVLIYWCPGGQLRTKEYWSTIVEWNSSTSTIVPVDVNEYSTPHRAQRTGVLQYSAYTLLLYSRVYYC